MTVTASETNETKSDRRALWRVAYATAAKLGRVIGTCGQHFARGIEIDHQTDPELDYPDEVDMKAFAVWLREHGILDTSVLSIRALYLEFAMVCERRAMSEKTMQVMFPAAGIVAYRPRLADGTRVTRYRVRAITPAKPVDIPAKPAVKAAKPGAVKPRHRSIADVSTVSSASYRRLAA